MGKGENKKAAVFFLQSGFYGSIRVVRAGKFMQLLRKSQRLKDHSIIDRADRTGSWTDWGGARRENKWGLRDCRCRPGWAERFPESASGFCLFFFSCGDLLAILVGLVSQYIRILQTYWLFTSLDISFSSRI